MHAPPRHTPVSIRSPGTVSAIHADAGSDHAIVQVAVGRLLLLAQVTRDAVARLQLVVGMPVYALIKSVSIDVLAVRSNAG